uniref:C-type lectin domain-containing protein n=1 Tax=Kryptolebias marmoratus TaxID=37003 RepID=A0A3Q2ZG79_KRYMA
MFSMSFFFFSLVITAFFLSGLYVLSTNMVREYHYVNSPKTWAGAQTFCREVYTDLATVESKEENIRLLLETQEPGKLAWIGLYDDTKSWMWTMGDGKFDRENSFFRWERNEPNNIGGKQSCVVMNWVDKWWDVHCDTELEFICEKLIPSRRRFKLRLQSEMDLNDPVIQQQILEQVP